jgi:membrane-associated phospholipid phosphatase
MKKVFVCLSFLSMCIATGAQTDSVGVTAANNANASVNTTDEQMYRIKNAVDIPLTVITAGWTIYGFTQVYSKDNSTTEQIQNLNVNNINGFDRWAADVYSEKAAKTSDLIFYGSMPLPALLFLDKKMSKDAGKISFLYLEAMSITGLLYTGATYLSDRYRPYAYNPNVPMGDRLEGGAKNSFFAGHVALVGTSTFFMAKVFSDYHPESKSKWLFYTGAAVATGATAYLRHRGGRHFPSDIVLGAAVGTLSGILVPHFHKNKKLKNSGLSIMPFTGQSHGLALVYKFK